MDAFTLRGTMASNTLEQDNSPKGLRASPCATARKDTYLTDQEASTNMLTRASQSSGAGLASTSSRGSEPQGLLEIAHKRIRKEQEAGSSSTPLTTPFSDHMQAELQFQTAAQWLGQETKDAKESRELRLKTHRVRAHHGEAIQKRDLDHMLTLDLLMEFSAPKRPRCDPCELDCPLFRLYAEEPRLFTGIDYFE